MDHAQFRWIKTGDQAMAGMLEAIRHAQFSVRLEMYIFNPDATGRVFREALVDACRRGVRVQVMVDAVGSMFLPLDYWQPLKIAGGQFRRFNPLSLRRLVFRDHRKILVCDETCAFVGGFNIGDEYTGDGVTKGWRDLGIVVSGKLVKELTQAFDDIFEHADFQHPRFARLRKSLRQKMVQVPEGQLLLSAPGRNGPFHNALHGDLIQGRDVRIISAYFLPSWRLRRKLTDVVRRGGRVQLILPSKTDVPLSCLAGQNFYSRLLRAGIEIYEYQPQILHTKLILIDNVVYIGSANLDPRSFNINYELLLRLPNPALAAEGRDIFTQDLLHCRRVTLQSWKKSGGFWRKLKVRFSCYLLSRIDPLIAHYLWRKLSVHRTLRKIKERYSKGR